MKSLLETLQINESSNFNLVAFVKELKALLNWDKLDMHSRSSIMNQFDPKMDHVLNSFIWIISALSRKTKDEEKEALEQATKNMIKVFHELND